MNPNVRKFTIWAISGTAGVVLGILTNKMCLKMKAFQNGAKTWLRIIIAIVMAVLAFFLGGYLLDMVLPPAQTEA